MTHPHIEHLHGDFNHRDALVSMAENVGIFETLSQQAAFGTDVEGIANRIAGLSLYNGVNMSNDMMAAIPDVDRTQDENINVDSDEPAATFRQIFDPPSVEGVAGGGAIPDSSRWETRKREARVKIMAIACESDFIHQIENRLGHDTVGWEELIEIMESFGLRSIERDGLARTVTAGDDTYDEDEMIVMLDRVVASLDEQENATDPSGDPYEPGDLDVYNIERADVGAGGDNEANSADATVDHGAGELRQLNGDLLNTAIDNHTNSTSAEHENLLIITGSNSARVMSDHREGQFRADALEPAGREDVNDARTRYGANWSSRISHWDGIPVVVPETVPSDGGGLERIYVLDTTPANIPGQEEALPKIAIENYRAPDVWRAGPDETVNPLATGEIKSEAAAAWYNELVARDVGAQLKLRDLEE